MGLGSRLSGWLLVLGQAAVGWLTERNYRALPLIPLAGGLQTGRVSIIVPARNEAERLPALLASLANLTYPDREVVVVDDDSTDGTARIAVAHGARLLRTGPLPAGWTGKSFACQVGADATSGEWLLFTDADTVHSPSSLDSALALADRSGAGLVSLLAQQSCQTFWERLLLPYAYALYFTGAGRINQPGGTPVANGQYLLFRRSAYRRIGGHEAVRDKITEDVALAHQAMRRGVDVALARAESQLEVRMYQDLKALWEGFGKNLFQFVRIAPRGGVLTALAAVTFSMAAPMAVRRSSWPLRLALLTTPAIALLPWYRRAGAPSLFAFLHPLTALVFQILVFDSIRRSLTHTASWKGRRY